MLRSRTLSFVLMAVLAALPWAPRAHVHAVREADGEHHVVHTHRQAHTHHVAPNHHGDHDADRDADHDQHRATLDHDESVVATLEPVFTVPATHLLAAPVSTLLGLIAEPPPLQRLARAGFVERLIHGPPRAPAAERGPPSISLL